MWHIRHIERQATEGKRSVKGNELTFIWLHAHAHARDRQQFDNKVRGNFKFNGFLISSYAWRKSIVRLKDDKHRAWQGCRILDYTQLCVTETEDMAIDEGLYGNGACWFIKLRNWYLSLGHDALRIPVRLSADTETSSLSRWIDGGCYWNYRYIDNRYIDMWFVG